MFQFLKNYFWHLPKAIFAAAINGFPCSHLILIGVTGTDGKTTTCNLIYETLINSGYKTGLLSNIGAKIGTDLLPNPPHMSSPDPLLIQNIFRQMANNSVTHVVVEVSAHALDQFRFSGCRFKVATITNTAHEHLDYFHQMSKYIKTKAKLFNMTDIGILNRDDPSFQLIKNLYPSKKFLTYSQKQPADFQAKNIKITKSSLSFFINNIKLITDSLYSYQTNNILASYAICVQLNIANTNFLQTIKTFPFMKGRREEVENKFKIRSIIDFAQTPQALEKTLLSLKAITSGKLITIFGASVGRDQSKRSQMGKIVSKYSDIAIVTANDTGTELIENINQQIIKGFDEHRLASSSFSFYNIPGRQDAFNLALKLAVTGDTVVACGKGHETTILHGTTEYPWSERSAFMTAFKLKETNV